MQDTTSLSISELSEGRYRIMTPSLWILPRARHILYIKHYVNMVLAGAVLARLFILEP
jgi:hypothetical protein